MEEDIENLKNSLVDGETPLDRAFFVKLIDTLAAVNLTGIATENYVDTAIAEALNAIGVAEEGAY